MLMEQQEIEQVQRTIARIIATSPAGINLLLIGGFRFRLLDHSQRFSADIDYHWGADLDQKQQELLQVCKRLILGQVRRQLGYEARSEEHTSELQSLRHLVCRLLLEKKKKSCS